MVYYKKFYTNGCREERVLLFFIYHNMIEMDREGYHVFNIIFNINEFCRWYMDREGSGYYVSINIGVLLLAYINIDNEILYAKTIT